MTPPIVSAVSATPTTTNSLEKVSISAFTMMMTEGNVNVKCHCSELATLYQLTFDMPAEKSYKNSLQAPYALPSLAKAREDWMAARRGEVTKLDSTF